MDTHGYAAVFPAKSCQKTEASSEPTEGIQPSIIRYIELVIDLLRNRGDMAIVLVEQYFEFTRDLADAFAVMDRGVVLAGSRSEMVEADVRRYLTV